MREPVIERAGAARKGSDEGGEAFGEGATRAARIDTEEAANMQLQGDTQAIDGQIAGMTPVGAMDPSGPAVATWAGSGVTTSGDGEGEVPIARAHIVNAQTGEVGEERGDSHDSDSL